MRDDNNITNQRDDNPVENIGQRKDHTVGNPKQRIDHIDNQTQRIDHEISGSAPIVIKNEIPDEKSDRVSVEKSEPTSEPKTENGGNTPTSLPWKVLFVVVLIGFMIAVGMLIKDKTENNPDKETTVPVTTENSVSVSYETPLIDETSNELTLLAEKPYESTEVISTAKTTEKFNSGELSNVINEIITTVKTTAKTVYTLTLDSNGGDNPNETRKITSGETSTLPFAQKTYYITYNSNGGKMDILRSEFIIDCLGWSKNKNGTSPDYSCGIPYYPTKNETLYAIWSPNVDVKITDEKPTRSGYNFLGWSTNLSASTATYRPNDFIEISTNTTLYAIWEEVQYNSGYIQNGEYVNDWANIRLQTESFNVCVKEFDEPIDNIELGVGVESGLNSIMIAFISGYPYNTKTEAELLSEEVSGFKSENPDISFFEETTGLIQFTNTTKIAGHSYSSHLMGMKNSNNEEAYVLLCLRKIGDRFCYIIISAETKNEIQQLVEMIKPY